MAREYEENGDVNAVLILNNYLANNIDMSNLFPYLTIKFLTPNITNNHQTVNMGMTAALNIGYK